MSIKGHATLLNLVSVIGAVGTLAGAAVIGFLTRRLEMAFVALLAGGLTLWVAWAVLLRFIPIECDQPGCPGRVWHKWPTQETIVFVVLATIRYVCNDCAHETDATIVMFGGGGDSWD